MGLSSCDTTVRAWDLPVTPEESLNSLFGLSSWDNFLRRRQMLCFDRRFQFPVLPFKLRLIATEPAKHAVRKSQYPVRPFKLQHSYSKSRMFYIHDSLNTLFGLSSCNSGMRRSPTFHQKGLNTLSGLSSCNRFLKRRFVSPTPAPRSLSTLF